MSSLKTLVSWAFALGLTVSLSAAAGPRLAPAGDVDRDGHVDWVIGQPRDSSLGRSSGRAVVRSGADGRILHVFLGNSPGDRFGWSVGAAGDIDRDSHADVLVGAPLDDENGNASGSVFVYSGRDGSLLRVFRGQAAGHHLGHAVGMAGDVNGDGVTDLALEGRRDQTEVRCGRTGELLEVSQE